MGRRRIYPVKTRKNPIDPITMRAKIGRPKLKSEVKIPRPRGRKKKSGEYSDVKINLSNIILEEARAEAEKFFNNNMSSYIAHLIKNDVCREVKQINVYKTGTELLREMFPDINTRKFEDIVRLIGTQNRKEVLTALRRCFLIQNDITLSYEDLAEKDSKEFTCKLPLWAWDILRFTMKYHKITESEAVLKLIGNPISKYRNKLSAADTYKRTSVAFTRDTYNMLIDISQERHHTMTQVINDAIIEEHKKTFPNIETKGE